MILRSLLIEATPYFRSDVCFQRVVPASDPKSHVSQNEMSDLQSDTSDFKNEEMSDVGKSVKNKGEKGSLQSVELWSDLCGERLGPGLKPLYLPRAQAPYMSEASPSCCTYVEVQIAHNSRHDSRDEFFNHRSFCI